MPGGIKVVLHSFQHLLNIVRLQGNNDHVAIPDGCIIFARDTYPQNLEVVDGIYIAAGDSYLFRRYKLAFDQPFSNSTPQVTAPSMAIFFLRI